MFDSWTFYKKNGSTKKLSKLQFDSIKSKYSIK